MLKRLALQMTMHYGGIVITVEPSIRLRRLNTFFGCATTARRQGMLGDIVLNP